DKSIYFLAEGSSLAAPVWRQLCTQRHGLNSTVRPAGESADLTFDQPGELLYANLSPLRHGAPFFYGRVENFVVIYMFKPGPGTELRFAHSPSGGGKTKDGTDTNPAWDCQMIVPEYEVGKTYQMDARLVYKPWKNREDVLAEARAWLEAEK
ncbi:MAG: hypothetical protein IT368_00120, partial [Candidatus Hydrogenedentes bacterium]|nr:hypothetical protein [Candidatus Hydrogenedentota bacterium]